MIYIGICKKVKPSYGYRSHCHNDNDARIGMANKSLVTASVPSFTVFKELMNKTFADKVHIYLAYIELLLLLLYFYKGECCVERIVGITDYDTMFAGTISESAISGNMVNLRYYHI